jgi:hypothetical protein
VTGIDPNLCISQIATTSSQSASISDREWKLKVLLQLRQNHSLTYDGLARVDAYLEEYSSRKVDAVMVRKCCVTY